MSTSLNEKQAVLLARLRAGQARVGLAAAAIPPAVLDGELPISRAQRRIVFEEQLYPGNTFNGTLTLEYAGELDVPALQQALDAIVLRHAILRSNAVFDGRRWGARYTPHASMPLDVIDLSDLPAAQGERRLVELGREQANRRIDIFRHPVLIRAMLVRLANRHHVLALAMHMYAFDAPSGAILADELATIYHDLAAGRSITLPPLEYQYADYIAWEARTAPADHSAGIRYWRQQLGGLNSPLELPADRRRRSEPNFTAGRFPFDVEPGLTARLKNLAKQQGVSFYVILLAALSCTLSRHTSQSHIPIGAWSVQRNARTLNLIGPFVNTVVYKTAVDPSDTFLDLLGKVRAAAHGVYAHGQVPFEDVVAACDLPHDSRINPLFQVHFILQEVGPRNGVGGFSLSRFDALIGAAGGYDVELVIRDLERGVEGHFECNASLFTADEAARLRDRFLALLSAVVENPGVVVGSIPLGEASPLVGPALARSTPVSASGFAGCLEHDRPALVARDNRVVTGWELERLVASTSARLLAELEPGALTAIVPGCVAQTVVAILGALRARMPFLVVDPGNSGSVLDDRAAHPVRGVLRADEEGMVLECRRGAPQPLQGSATSIAYYAWSSGTGGERRLAPVSRDRFSSYLEAIITALDCGPDTISMPFADPWSDVFLEETLPALLAGGRVVAGPKRSATSLSGLTDALCTSRATHLNVPSSFWDAWARLLLQRGERLPASLRTIVVGSEPVRLETVREWQARHGDDILMIHAYGVSECAVTSLTFRVPHAAAIDELRRLPIGAPLPGQWADVRDRSDRSVPAGVVGEIVVGFTGEDAAIRTGDLGRRRTDGDVEWLGRVDGREKRLGNWINLDTLDAALKAHPKIAACKSDMSREGRPTICTSIQVAPEHVHWFGGEAADGFPELRAFLRRKSPDVVFPDTVVLDGSPQPPLPAGVDDDAMQSIVRLWAQILGRQPPVSVNLFEAGVTSMDFMEFTALAEAQGLPLPLSDVYDLQTLEAQASYLREQRARSAPRRPEGSREAACDRSADAARAAGQPAGRVKASAPRSHESQGGHDA